MELELTSINYDELVEDNENTVLIDFWATWCGPCRMIAPIIAEIAEEREDITVCKVNVDEQPELAAQFQITAIPTLVVMKDNEIRQTALGYREKQEILDLLDA